MPFLSSKTVFPSLRQLSYFVEVAKHLNYRRAASSLGLSQPTLTTQINKLEQELGIQLFERSRTGTLLSADGRELFLHAQQLLQNVRQFQDVARTLADGPQTTYRLGIPPTLGPYLLPHIIPQLHKLYARLKFYVREGAPSLLEQGLVNGDFDLILSPIADLNHTLSVEPLFVEPLKFVMPSDHKLAGQVFIDPNSIRGEKILTLEDNHHFHYQVLDICQQLGAQLQRDFEGTSLDTLREMVVMGMGCAFLPGLYVHSEMHQPESLHVCELAGMPIIRSHALAWRNTSPSRVFFRELVVQCRTIIQNRLSGVVTVI